VNSVTGEPVRRALVQVGSSAGGGQISMLTDAEGRFEFPALPESELVLTARKPGFFNDLELHPEYFHYDTIHLASDTSSVVLKLHPESSIFGHVLTLKDPVEDCPVRVFEERIVDGRKQWEQRGQTMTDEDGQFRVANLVPGQYLLVAGPNLASAQAALFQVRSARPEGFGTIFYPGVSELEAATPVTVAGGQQLQVDFSLKPEPIFSISGTVVGLGEGVHPALQIVNRAGEALSIPVNFDRQTGKFKTKLPGGAYVIQLRGQDSAGLLFASDLPLTVHADVEGICLPLGPSITLPITVDLGVTGMTEVPDQANRLLRNAEGISSVRLIPREKQFQVQEFQAERNEKSRALAVRNLTPGRYTVEITAAPPWYVRAVTSGTTDLLREDLVIAGGRRPDPLEVVLRDDSSSLHGTIHADGQPSGGTVLLFSDQRSLEHAQTAVVQNGAEFLFSGLAPGDYKVLAFDSIEGLEFRNADAVSPYLSRAVAVTLQPNEATNVNLEQIRREK